MIEAVEVCEVGPRDGLQNEPRVLAPEIRAELVSRVAATGVSRVEAVSFVSDARVPAMAQPETVIARAGSLGTVLTAGLVLNERGYDRLALSGLDAVHVAFGVTDAFNRRNQGASSDESLAAARRIVRRARVDGRRTRVTLAVAFGCPFDGDVDPGRVLDVAAAVASAEPDELFLADTIGVGVPRQVRALVAGAVGLGVPLGLHLHATRNTGYANAFAGLEAGVRRLDAAVGGSGGCPYAPGAGGNLATEDLCWMLEKEGVATGGDVDALCATARWLGEQLGAEMPGRLHRAPIGVAS